MSELAHDPNQSLPDANEPSGQNSDDMHAPPEAGQLPGVPDPYSQHPETLAHQQEYAPGVPGQIPGDGVHSPDVHTPLLDATEHIIESQGSFHGSNEGLAPAAGEAMLPAEPGITAPALEQQPLTASQVSGRPLPRINIQAFCEDQNTVTLLQQASQDRRLSKTHVSVQMGGLEAAALYYSDAPTPNLIIIESLRDRDAMLMDLDRLASVCDEGTKVIVIGHVNDVFLYRELLQRGVSEYLVMPLTVSQVMESLSNLYNDPTSDPLGRVIAFIGAKGGVGSSAICHNTAWVISEEVKSDVVIADLDLPFGTAGLDFNQDPVQGIADALLSPERLDEVLLDRLLSRCSDYLSLFAAPGTLDRPYDLGSKACDAVVDVLRTNIPFIAVDVPHMWTEWSQRILMQSDRVVITAQPDLANLRNTKNLIEKLTAARPNDLPPLLVLNQVNTPKRPEISVNEFTGALNCEPFAVIEFDPQLFGSATNNGQMIEEVSPKSKASEQFRDMARILSDRIEEKSESKSILAPILSRLNLKKSGKK